MNAPDVLIDMAGHKVTYGTSTQDHAIRLGRSVQGFELFGNGTITGGVFADSQQGNALQIDNNTIIMEGTYVNGIRLYGSDWFDIYDNTITITTFGNNAKPIQIDGGSSHTLVHGNSIDLNSTDTSSNSYGIRIRFESNYNKIYANTINIEDSTGVYGAYGITFGATERSVDENGNPDDPGDTFVVRVVATDMDSSMGSPTGGSSGINKWTKDFSAIKVHYRKRLLRQSRSYRVRNDVSPGNSFAFPHDTTRKPKWLPCMPERAMTKSVR